MRRSRVLPAVILAALTGFIACTNGGECDKCSTDSDCKEEFICSNFLNPDGTLNSKRCGTGTGATTCRVP